MNRVMIMTGVCLLLAASCAKPADPPSEHADTAADAGIHMDAPTQARMGVRVAPIALANAPLAVQGYARVMDVGPLAVIDSEVGAAQAAAFASQEEYRRLSALAAQDQAASTRAVEAARAQAAADAARATLAARRIGLEWGAGLARMPYAERAQLLNQIAAGRAALLRIDAPDASGAVSRISVRPDDAASPIAVSVLGPAAATDARLQTTGVLGIVRGAAARSLPAGRLLRADLDLSAAQSGYLIPASALVRAGGAVWVYVKTGAEVFQRRDVSGGRPEGDGWFVASGFTGGEQIVIDGATSLLAVEHGPSEAE